MSTSTTCPGKIKQADRVFIVKFLVPAAQPHRYHPGMSRQTRIEFPGAFYHVMGRGFEKTEVLATDADRDLFLDGVAKWVERGELKVLAYCLMPTHYHLLVNTPDGGLSRMMRSIAGNFAQRFNRDRDRVGYVWHRRYKAILVEDGPYLSECSRYIHLNPVRAGLAASAVHWKWSSTRNYLGESARPWVDWVDTKYVLGALNCGTGAAAIEVYRRYMSEGMKDDLGDPFQRAVAKLVLGGESFVQTVRRLLKDHPNVEDLPSLKEIRKIGHLDPDAIEEGFSREFGDELSPVQLRRYRVFGLVNWSRMRRVEVARRYGISRSSVTQTVAKIEDSIARDAHLSRRLTSLIKRLESPKVRKN